MIRTVRELLDEIENQVGDHDESETPVLVNIGLKVGGVDQQLSNLTITYIEHFAGALVIGVT